MCGVHKGPTENSPFCPAHFGGRYRVAQAIKAEELKVAIVEKELQTQIQEREVGRRAQELLATVVKPAEAERQRIELLAQAEEYRRRAEAAGDADAIRARGFAEAEVTRTQGLAEAEAMRQKAEAWRHYNEAAVTEMVVNILHGCRAQSSPHRSGMPAPGSQFRNSMHEDLGSRLPQSL